MQERMAALDGVRNFRDFGGYPTEGGTVRAGVLFRSAHFAEASDGDAAWLDARGIATVVDLRRPHERRTQPSRWPGESDVRVEGDSGDDDGREAPHIALLRQPDLTAQVVDAFMVRLYQEIPFDPRLQRLFALFFNAIEQDGGASVVHCAAGKDRTGVVCALALKALGVSDTVVVEDYLLTNRAVDVEGRASHVQSLIETQLGKRLETAAILPMLGVRAAYLEAAFAAIGDVPAYLETALGVDRARIGRLRNRLIG
jgi:protein-tyrosine phosphatase